jgi:hypothetical protein
LAGKSAPATKNARRWRRFVVRQRRRPSASPSPAALQGGPQTAGSPLLGGAPRAPVPRPSRVTRKGSPFLGPAPRRNAGFLSSLRAANEGGPLLAGGAEGKTMRRDRPSVPEQPGSACGPGSCGSLHLGSTARYAFRLTKGRQRSSFSGANRTHPGNVGFQSEGSVIAEEAIRRIAGLYAEKDGRDRSTAPRSATGWGGRACGSSRSGACSTDTS